MSRSLNHKALRTVCPSSPRGTAAASQPAPQPCVHAKRDPGYFDRPADATLTNRSSSCTLTR